MADRKSKRTKQQNKRGDRKGKSNDSSEIPDSVRVRACLRVSVCLYWGGGGGGGGQCLCMFVLCVLMSFFYILNLTIKCMRLRHV